VGLALAVQLVAEVPAGRYDQRVGLVVTEDEAVRAGTE
jgi:5-formyltetrahydrofolate cyclo-ligase